MPLLHGEVDDLYRAVRIRAATDARLQEALAALENAWERQSVDSSQFNAKEAIRTASFGGKYASFRFEFSRALGRMRIGNRFPGDDFANIFDRAYDFANIIPAMQPV